MRLLILALLVTLFGTSCKKDSVGKIKNGTYVGKFSRSSPLSLSGSSNVTLTFDGKRFSGSSDVSNYPAICNGTYSADANKLKVENECMFTANFDWTFIFDREYDYEVAGEELRIFRRYPNSDFVDNYNLERVK